MEIQLRGTGKREHVSQTVAECLIAAGLATEVKPDPLTRMVQETAWSVFNPTDPQYPPFVKWKCPNCNFSGEIVARDILTPLVYPVKHGSGCKGHEEFIPADIVQRFKDLYKAWENRSKPQPKMVENPRRWFAQKVG
jgi:hypothetical protein